MSSSLIDAYSARAWPYKLVSHPHFFLAPHHCSCLALSRAAAAARFCPRRMLLLRLSSTLYASSSCCRCSVSPHWSLLFLLLPVPLPLPLASVVRRLPHYVEVDIVHARRSSPTPHCSASSCWRSTPCNCLTILHCRLLLAAVDSVELISPESFAPEFVPVRCHLLLFGADAEARSGPLLRNQSPTTISCSLARWNRCIKEDNKNYTLHPKVYALFCISFITLF
jgi:hypothetical protein